MAGHHRRMSDHNESGGNDRGGEDLREVKCSEIWLVPWSRPNVNGKATKRKCIEAVFGLFLEAGTAAGDLCVFLSGLAQGCSGGFNGEVQVCSGGGLFAFIAVNSFFYIHTGINLLTYTYIF